jgi:HEAT repeat protein
MQGLTRAVLLNRMLSDEQWNRTQAMIALAAAGESVVSEMVFLLRSPNPTYRRRAAWVLRAMGEGAVPMLRSLVAAGEPQPRVEAIRILGEMRRGDLAFGLLLRCLADPKPAVASRAAAALGKLADVRAFHPLVTALRHPNADVRCEACRGLAYLPDPDAALPYLEQVALEDEGITSWGVIVAIGARFARWRLLAARQG